MVLVACVTAEEDKYLDLGVRSLTGAWRLSAETQGKGTAAFSELPWVEVLA